MKPITDIDGAPLSEEKQRHWRYADSIGLRPSEIRFMAGEPIAVYKDGTGIYGPCPIAPDLWEASEADSVHDGNEEHLVNQVTPKHESDL